MPGEKRRRAISTVVSVVLRGKNEEVVLAQCQELYEKLKERINNRIELSDPQADFIPKLRGNYRFGLMLKGKSVKKILPLIKGALKDFKRRGKTIITLNVDP